METATMTYRSEGEKRGDDDEDADDDDETALVEFR